LKLKHNEPLLSSGFKFNLRRYNMDAEDAYFAAGAKRGSDDGGGQGLTLVHARAQREHFLSYAVGCFAVISVKNGSG
jgi:hypothetical protein